MLSWCVLALGSCAPFLFVQPGGEQPSTRRRTGCGRYGREGGEGQELPRRWRAPRSRSSSRAGREGCVGRAPLPACPQLGLPAVARARRTWRRCAGPRRPSARPSAPVGGVGVVALAPHRKPRWSTTTLRCSTGEDDDIEFGGARAPHTPALARAQRPHPPAGPTPPHAEGYWEGGV